MPSFNLTSRAFIPCKALDGRRVELSLTEIFARAHELRSLASDSPLVDAAVYRLLLAILNRCFGPENDAAWNALWKAQRFDASVAGRYLAEWRHRFDLFDAKYPFYQVAGLVEQSPNYEHGKKPARELIAEQSSYGSPRNLFEGRPRDWDEPVPAAKAALWLIALQQFNPGGLLTRDTTNKDPTAVKAGLLCGLGVVVIQGENLFETLLLNLLPYRGRAPIPTTDDDAPVWETDPSARFERRECRGWLDWLTWRARRVQLFSDEEGRVREFVLLAGSELFGDSNEVLRDPMCAYKRHDKHGYVPVGFSKEHVLWRDSTALFEIEPDKGAICPVAVGLLTRRDAPRRRQYQLQVLGQVPEKASIALARSEVVPLPTALIERADLVGLVRRELERTRDVQAALRKSLFFAAAKVLSPGERNADTKEASALVASSQAIFRFWARMKAAFDELLVSIATDEEAALPDYHAALRREAWRAYQDASTAFAGGARGLKGSAVGRTTLARELAKAGVQARRQDSDSLAHEETV